MSEREQETAANGDRSASDETIRLYLLGGLHDAERSVLDQRLLNDDELAERLLLAETELTDDYAAGKMSATEANLFHTNFLVTDARRRKLGVAAVLRDYLVSQSDSPVVATTKLAKPSWLEGLRDLFGHNRRPAWVLAGSFAVLVLFTGVVLVALNRGRSNEPTIASHESAPAPQISPAKQPAPPAVASPAPNSTQTVQPKKPERILTPEESSVPPAIATFVLLPGAVREGGEMVRVAIPDGARDLLRLHLVLETTQEGPYRAELVTAEGQEVLVRDNLKPSASKAGKQIVLDVPSRLMKDGDYQVKLGSRRTGGIEPIGRYYFRALQ